MKLLKWLFGSRKPALNKPVSSSTEWIVNFIYGGKEQMRILQGESENIVRERFISVRPSAKITSVVCLNCGYTPFYI